MYSLKKSTIRYQAMFSHDKTSVGSDGTTLQIQGKIQRFERRLVLRTEKFVRRSRRRAFARNVEFLP
jgi:hypothetical protein